MSSLWTPSGEHKVEREPDGDEIAGRAPSDDTAGPVRRGGPPTSPGKDTAQGDGTDYDENLEYDEEALDEVRRQLLDAPVEVVIANHAYGLFELAAIHLSAAPPNLDQARLAVDALGAIVEGLQGRLGQVEASLREALAQIRLAYVQIGGSAGDPENPTQA